MFFSAYQVFTTAPNICCGDLQLERFGMKSWKLCSQNLIQPGEHEVMSGSGPPFCILLMSSCDSSIIVRSAAMSVSYTPANPRCLRAVTILPLTLVPTGIPNASPRVTLMDGAVATITCLLGSARACHTLSVSSFSAMAPVGQTTMHWPHDTQSVLPRSSSNAQPTWVLKPLSFTPITPTLCSLLQAATHLLHRMHLLSSLYMWIAESSVLYTWLWPSNLASSSTLKS